MTIIHIEYAGPIVRLPVNGRYHTFEMHRYCGPIRLKSDGETPTDKQWGENSPFWDVFYKWLDNGQKVDEHGRGLIDVSN